MKIAVIIVTYNAMEWIQRCLESISNPMEELEIIVIDNCSKDNTIPFIKENFPEVNLIESKENLGFGKANNLGISIALKNNTDYYFLLNQDAWVEGDAITSLVELMEKNPEYGILSPIHLNGAGSLLDLGFFTCITNKKALYQEREFLTDYIKKEVKSLYQFKFVNAAAWMVSKKCIETIGGFDPLFYHYGEDNNYIQRVKFHGFKLGVSTKAIIYHDREDRIVSKSKNGYKQLELNMMKTISDINLKSTFNYRYNFWKKNKLKEIVKAIVTLNLSEIKMQVQLLKKLSNAKKDIENSIQSNLKKGLNWL